MKEEERGELLSIRRVFRTKPLKLLQRFSLKPLDPDSEKLRRVSSDPASAFHLLDVRCRKREETPSVKIELPSVATSFPLTSVCTSTDEGEKAQTGEGIGSEKACSSKRRLWMKGQARSLVASGR